MSKVLLANHKIYYNSSFFDSEAHLSAYPYHNYFSISDHISRRSWTFLLTNNPKVPLYWLTGQGIKGNTVDNFEMYKFWFGPEL